MHWLASPRFNYHLHSGSTGWPSANVQDMAPTRLKIPKAVERLAGDRSLARPESGRRPRYQPGNRSPSLEQCHNIGPGKHQAVMRFKLIPLRDVIEGGRGHALHLRHRHPDGVEMKDGRWKIDALRRPCRCGRGCADNHEHGEKSRAPYPKTHRLMSSIPVRIGSKRRRPFHIRQKGPQTPLVIHSAACVTSPATRLSAARSPRPLTKV
jgi:hypothetical protein